MKVEFYNTKGKGVDPSLYSQGRFSFKASRPIIVQPSEIMKVQTDLVVRVPEGCILSIVSSHALFRRTGELFPANLVITSMDSDFVLELPIRNCGRNPINIMPEQEIASGFVLASVDVEIGEFDLLAEQSAPKKSSPQKKNSNIKFELT